MKKLTALILTLCIIFALGACGGTGDTEKAGEFPSSTQVTGTASQVTVQPSEQNLEPIKIGHIVDLTGNEASTGMEAQRSLQFAIDAIGGEIAGHPVEIIVCDGQGTPATAADVARQMVEGDKVACILGPTQAGQKSAVSEYMATVEVPLIFYSGSPAGLFASNEWLVGAGGANPQIPTVMADYAYNVLGYRKVNVITMDNVGFRSFTDLFEKTFTELGGEILTQQYAPLPCSDWTPYQIGMSSDADAIVAWMTGGDAIAFWRMWYESGLYEKMPVMPVMQAAFTDYYILDALNNINPDIANAVLGTVSPTMYVYDSPVPENQEFIELWKAEYGSYPSTNLPGQCYQVALLLKEAIKATGGDTEPEALRSALFAADFTGPAGHLSFADSNVGTRDVYIVENVKLDDGSFNYSIITEYKDVPPEGITGK